MAGLKDKYCIVGVGETEYSKHSGRSTRAMAVEAVKNAMADAGLKASDVDGIMSYQSGDSTPGNWVAPDLGIRPNFYMDVFGGGSSSEALVGLAMGAIESGMCNTIAIFRSMNGYSDFRIGGTGARAAQPVRGLDLAQVPFGMRSAGRVNKPRTDFHWAAGPISRVAGYYAKDIVFGQAGIKPEDVDVTGSYDAFTFTTMLQLEEYGFCKKGEGGHYVSSGIIELGGKRPKSTSGAHL